MRASLRKFLDWCETPGWHEARDVTPAEWGRTFPDKGWVNAEALRLLRFSADTGSRPEEIPTMPFDQSDTFELFFPFRGLSFQPSGGTTS